LLMLHFFIVCAHLKINVGVSVLFSFQRTMLS